MGIFLDRPGDSPRPSLAILDVSVPACFADAPDLQYDRDLLLRPDRRGSFPGAAVSCLLSFVWSCRSFVLFAAVGGSIAQCRSTNADDRRVGGDFRFARRRG